MPLESGETNRAFVRNSLNQRDVAAADMRVTFNVMDAEGDIAVSLQFGWMPF